MLESLTNDALDDVLSKLSLHALCKIACLSPALQTCSTSPYLWLDHYNKYCKKSSKTSTNIRNIKKKTVDGYLRCLKRHPAMQYGIIDDITLVRLEALTKGYLLQINALKRRKSNNAYLTELLK